MVNLKKVISKEFVIRTSEELKTINPDEEELTIWSDDRELIYKVTTVKVYGKQNFNKHH